MRSGRLARKLALVAGGAAIVGMVGLSAACGTEEEAPETTTPTTTTTTSQVPVEPTEKKINPTGGNLFTPPVTATPAPTAPPGDN